MSNFVDSEADKEAHLALELIKSAINSLARIVLEDADGAQFLNPTWRAKYKKAFDLCIEARNEIRN